MTDTYTFRYLKADGSFRGITMVQLNDWHSAEICAENLMPKTAASVEIWCGGDLISTQRNARPHASDHSSSSATQAGL